MILKGPLREEVRYQKFQKGLRSNVVLTLELKKLVRRGLPLYLCHINQVGKGEKNPKKIPVVGEFVDIFPEEKTRMPPQRDIDFTIDLVPGT